MAEEQTLNAVELATELTIAWLGNQNNRVQAEDVPQFLRTMHATVTDLAGSLLPWVLALRELKGKELLAGIRPTLRPTALEGAWRFAINVNLTTSVQAVWGPIGRLVVGGLLGPAGAALCDCGGCR